MFYPFQVYIRVITAEGGEFIWGRDHFLDRFDLMMTIFQKYEVGDHDWNPTNQVYPACSTCLLLSMYCFLLFIGDRVW